MEINNVYLIGASGHAKVIADILNVQQRQVAAVFDKNPDIVSMLEFEVLPQPCEDLPTEGEYLVCIGNNHIRKRLVDEINKKIVFSKAVHPKSVISSYAMIGEGTVVMAGAVINVNVSIGKHVIINTGCTVDHDCIIGDYVHISPQVGLAGDVKVGEGTHIGIGASVIQGITIGRWATIGAGAVVINDVPDYAVVVGNPGKIIKYNKPSE